MRHIYSKKLKTNESGFASIVIALVLIVVLGLLTVAFAQFARREQQNSLQKQLANQANYAAETGINDAYQAIQNGVGFPANSDTQCVTDATIFPHPVISASTGASYSCVLVNMEPPELVKDLSADNDWHTVFGVAGGGGLKDLLVTWHSMSGHTGSGVGLGSFPPVSSWTAPAVLQVSITPLASTSRQNLITNTYTTYLYPMNVCGFGCGTATYSNVPANQGSYTRALCNAGTCKATITGIDAIPAAHYLVNIKDIYDGSHIVLTSRDATPSTLRFTGSQAIIDVTGKARNVLKRLQVHVPIQTVGGNVPSDALEAQSICKRFKTAPTNSENPSGTSFVTPTGSNAASGDPCKLDE